MKILFWFSMVWIFYAYAGYLVVLMMVTGLKRHCEPRRGEAISEDGIASSLASLAPRNDRKTAPRNDGRIEVRNDGGREIASSSRNFGTPRNDEPTVSLIIAAFNEKKSMEEKLRNCLELDYPRGKLEIIVASDASTDGTDEIVRGFANQGVVLVRQNEHRGKTAVQNLAVSRAKGKILAFSDATTIYGKDALRKLVRNFEDAGVGCVGGEERFIDRSPGHPLDLVRLRLPQAARDRHVTTSPVKEITEEAGFFWRYEQLLREKESEFNSLIGVSGCIFAIRKELYEPLDDSLIEDFALPLKVASKGFKVVYEKAAVGYEKAAVNTKAELLRKTRIVTGGINVLFKMKELLNPFRYPALSFQLVSHKIFRWFAPVFMFLLFVSNLSLLSVSRFFFITGICQLSFYVLAILGHFIRNRSFSPKIVRMIYHFCFVNFAAVLGMMRFLKGERKVVWQPVR